MKAVEKILKNWGLIFFPTKHKSSHNFSTRHFDDKVTSDLDFLAHLAPKNNIMSFSPVLRTPWSHLCSDIRLKAPRTGTFKRRKPQ